MRDNETTIDIADRTLKLISNERTLAVLIAFEQKEGFSQIEKQVGACFALLQICNPDFKMDMAEFCKIFFETPEVLEPFERWSDKQFIRLAASMN